MPFITAAEYDALREHVCPPASRGGPERQNASLRPEAGPSDRTRLVRMAAFTRTGCRFQETRGSQNLVEADPRRARRARQVPKRARRESIGPP